MSYGTPYHHLVKTPPFSLGGMALQTLYPHQDCIGNDQTWIGSTQPSPRRGQKQLYPGSLWQHQPDFPQHFDNQTKKAVYSSSPALAVHVTSRPGMEVVSSFPLATGPRMVSPSPSRDLSTPTSSNARSPATDPEWYSDSYNTPQIHDDLPFPADMAYLNHDLGSACTGMPPLALFAEPTRYPCVNMSQVQGFIDSQDFVEPQEDAFGCNETYLEVGQNEYSIEVDVGPLRGAEVRASPRNSFAINEGHGTMKDADYIQEQDLMQTPADMEGDLEEEDDEMAEDEASDTDYSPKATRSNKRRSAHPSKPLSSSAGRRGRAMKSKSLRPTKAAKGQPAFACRTCKAAFNDATGLQRHVDNSHPRVFTCVFNFAGCTSTFASKNEWKRHVSTQHLNFNTWLCNLDACGKPHNQSPSGEKNASGGQSSKGATFNRKDLFTQHLRRMHAPLGPKRQVKQKAEFDDRIKALQESCKQVNRHGPRALKCPVASCGVPFGGSKCWDDRMEHVAKHLEKVASTRGSASVQHDNDELLVNWAMNENIIELVDGVYKLVPIATLLEGLDQDAECEDE